MPPRTQSALLEAMEERQVTIDGTQPRAVAVVHDLRDPEPGRVRGHLSAARSAARSLPGQDSRDLSGRGVGHEEAILERHQRGLRRARAGQGRDRADRARASSRRRARRCARSASSRRSSATSRRWPGARATGRRWPRRQPARRHRAAARWPRRWPRSTAATTLLPDDVKAVAAPVLRHRLVLRPEADLEGVTTDQRRQRHRRRGRGPQVTGRPRAAQPVDARPARRAHRLSVGFAGRGVLAARHRPARG